MNNTTKFQSDLGKNTSFGDVFKKAKENILLQTHCATLAKVKKIFQEKGDNQYSIVEASPFPLYENETEYTVQAYYFGNKNLSEDDIVLIVFTDYDFRKCLQTDNYGKTVNKDMHSRTFGVLLTLN